MRHADIKNYDLIHFDVYFQPDDFKPIYTLHHNIFQFAARNKLSKYNDFLCLFVVTAWSYHTYNLPCLLWFQQLHVSWNRMFTLVPVN